MSGVSSLSQQRERLVSAGMSVKLAETLQRDYLNTVAEQSSVHTLMDFFCNERAKRALHNPVLDLQQVCLNYDTRSPSRYSSVRQGLAERAIAAAGRVAPVRPIMGSVSARVFSSQIQTSDSEAEDETETKGGRFFKFLEKAEKLDENIKEDPALAKKVFKEGDEELEQEIMFDADEIEISFAD